MNGWADSVHTTTMNKVRRIMRVLVLLALLSFCVFGFMATFEPLDTSTQLTWCAVYGLVGLACLAGLVVLLRPQSQSP